MYQDPEVAQIIRRLDEKKREAVRHECYDHAKKLKQAIADLQKVLLKDFWLLSGAVLQWPIRALLFVWNRNDFLYISQKNSFKIR